MVHLYVLNGDGRMSSAPPVCCIHAQPFNTDGPSLYARVVHALTSWVRTASFMKVHASATRRRRAKPGNTQEPTQRVKRVWYTKCGSVSNAVGTCIWTRGTHRPHRRWVCPGTLLPVHECVGRVAVRVSHNIACVHVGMFTRLVAIEGLADVQFSNMPRRASRCRNTQHRVAQCCAVLACTAARSCDSGSILIMR